MGEWPPPFRLLFGISQSQYDPGPKTSLIFKRVETCLFRTVFNFPVSRFRASTAVWKIFHIIVWGLKNKKLNGSDFWVVKVGQTGVGILKKKLTSSSIIEDIWSYKIIEENNPNNEDSINKLTTWGVWCTLSTSFNFGLFCNTYLHVT